MNPKRVPILPYRKSLKRLFRLTTRRYRRILVAALITLIISITLLSLVGLIKWRQNQALQSDTHTVISEVNQQLVRSLQSRRGTLTFIRDSIKPNIPLSTPQLRAMGSSAVKHTRHLLGTGLVNSSGKLTWWHQPSDLNRTELRQTVRSVVQRSKIPRIWEVPSTFVTDQNMQPLLIMLEPILNQGSTRGAVIGIFDLRHLLRDFFDTGLRQHYPVQITDDTRILFRSNDWQTQTDENQLILVEDDFHVDAARWKIQMQPSSSRLVETLSWFHVLIGSLSVITGLGITALVWLLATRTWILQRAVARRTAALRRTSARLRLLATTDELTGLHNRRFFLDRWSWEYERSRRYERPLACLMIDINGFKQVNDRYGHHTGDLVLQRVAKKLKRLLRQSDILARFGGDEFIVALPETTIEQAEIVVKKLRSARIPVISNGENRKDHSITLSVGLSHAGQDGQSPQDTIQAADQALYEHKRQSRSTATRS